MAVIKSGASADNWTIDPTSKAGRVSLYDTAGNPIDSTLDTNGEYHIGAAIIQSVYASTKNSEASASILASSYWEGASEETFGVNAIQVNSFLTQAHTSTLYQSGNGTDWDISDSHDVPANYGDSRTYQATASYYKVRITNKSGASTATGRIQTALCPVCETLPRALTKGGNLKVSVAAEWQSNTRTTGLYGVNTYRTIGDTNATQNVFCIYNSSSLYWVGVRSLTGAAHSTAVNTSIPYTFKTYRTTGAPTGGTALTATKYRTEFQASQITALGQASADGTNGTAITATPVSGPAAWSQYMPLFFTAVGWAQHAPFNLLPDAGADLRQLVLAPGEALLVQVIASIPATTHMLVNCSWSEMLSL